MYSMSEFDVVKEEITYDKNGYSTRTIQKKKRLIRKGDWHGSNLDSLRLEYKTAKLFLEAGWILANPDQVLIASSRSFNRSKENEYQLHYKISCSQSLYTVKGSPSGLTLHAFDPDYIYYALIRTKSSLRQIHLSATILIVEESQSLLLLSAKWERYWVR